MIDTIDIRCNDLCIIDNEIWFSNAEMNGLYKKELNKENAEFVSFFPNEGIWQKLLHGSIIHYENKLVFTPLLADTISVYDLGDRSFYSYKIDWLKEGLSEKVSFIWSVLYGKYVYMFGNYQPCILKFDIESGKYNCVNGWFDRFQRFGYRKERELFSERGIKVEEKLYLFTKQNNILMEFDLKSERFHFHSVGNENDRFISGEYNNGNFWLISMQGEILEWNQVEGVIKRIPVTLDSDYYRSIRYKRYVFFLPSGNGKIAFCINSLTKTVEWKNLGFPIQVLKEMFGGLFFYSNRNSTLYRLNRQGWDVSGRLSMDSSVFNLMILRELEKEKNGLVYEDCHWKLDNFLEIVSHGRRLVVKDIQENIQVGNRIFNEVL